MSSIKGHIGALIAGLLMIALWVVSCAHTGICWRLGRPLTDKEFCEAAIRNTEPKSRRDLITGCGAELNAEGLVGIWYTRVNLAFSDPSICAGSSCTAVFDACGTEFRM